MPRTGQAQANNPRNAGNAKASALGSKTRPKKQPPPRPEHNIFTLWNFTVLYYRPFARKAIYCVAGPRKGP